VQLRSDVSLTRGGMLSGIERERECLCSIVLMYVIMVDVTLVTMRVLVVACVRGGTIR